MQSGKLRSKLEIQRSTNGTWAKLKDIYCSVKVTGGSEDVDSETGYADTLYEFLMRRDGDITTKDRAVYEGNTCYIYAIAPDPTNRRHQIVRAIEKDY